METRTLQVNPEDTGTRLDAWLAGQLPDVTRSAAARLCPRTSPWMWCTRTAT